MRNAPLFRNKYRIPSARLQGWDYRMAAPYFITICTKQRAHIFGHIENEEMHLNDLGKHTVECINNISMHSQCATVVNQIVMPNHIHLIIELNNNTDKFHPNTFGPLLSKSISSVINHLKGRVTKFANDNSLPSGWQERFHDHIIRDSDEYSRIFDYISNNPKSWNSDKFNQDHSINP